MKPFNEIMTDVQNAETMSEVLEIATYMQDNKKKYTLTELRFAKEYIQEKYDKIKEQSSVFVKWLAALLDIDKL